MTDTAEWKPGEFVEWIEKADRSELVPFLCSLTDKDRRGLSKEVAAAFRKVRHDFERHGNLRITLLAVCPWTEVKRANNDLFLWSARSGDSDVVKVLKARAPEWIDDFVAQELEREWPRWQLVRRLVREGVVEKPASDIYITSMVRTHLGEWSNESLYARIMDDPGLLDDEIWRLFEVEPAEGAMFGMDSASWRVQDTAWGPTLVALARDGKIDRSRLLRSVHETLRRGIQLKDSGFHLRLIERLEMDPKERAALGDVYLDLMAHRTDAVVKFASEQCEALLREGALAPAAVLSRVAPALRREKKGPVEAALKLIRKIVKKDASLAAEAAKVTLEALRHPSPDIHEKALNLIHELGAPAELSEYLVDVAPSQRKRFIQEPMDPVVSAPDADQPAVRFVPSERAPRLDETKRVEPIRDFTEMVDVMLATMETQASPADVERSLDAFSRLAAAPPSDYRARTAALLQRTTQQSTGAGDWSGAGTTIMRLVQLWLRGGSGIHVREDTPEYYLELRADEIYDRVSKKCAAPMLALPTHGAWIDPRALIERIHFYIERQWSAGRRDVLQALLRLAPEHRGEALESARRIGGLLGAVLRYALGGDVEPVEAPSSLLGRFFAPKQNPKSADWPLWAAAARARDPFGVDSSLEGTPAATLHYVVAPPRYSWSVRSVKTSYMRSADYFVDLSSQPADAKDSEWPLSLFFERGQRWIFGSEADIRQRFTVWPADPEPVFIAGINSVVDRMFRPASAFTPTAVFLEPLLDPNVRVSPLAELVLALALVARDADARTMAVDVAVALISDRRILGGELGQVYAKLMQTEGFLKFGRVAEALKVVAPASAIHQVACARLIEEILAAIEPPGPRDLHHLLTQYRELLAATGRCADPRLARLTQSATGDGKTARLLKEIASLMALRTSGSPDTA